MQNKVFFYIIGTLFFATVLVSCKNTETKTTQEPTEHIPKIEYDISWLEGSWIDSTKFGFKKEHYFETWKILKQNILEGQKFKTNNGVSNEPTIISITKNEEKYYYSYQYNNKQISYYSDSLDQNYIRLICNMDKFPQTIEYNRIKDTLFISLSGMAGGVFRNPIYKTLKY